jgi:hypothetical protein
MWCVSIPNTPHPYLQQLVIFEVLNELNCIWETSFQQLNLLFCPQIRLELVGHPCECIILHRAHKTLVVSFANVIFFMTFSTHAFHRCPKRKSTQAFGQALLHGKFFSIRKCAPLQQWQKQIKFTLRICLFYCGECT